MEFNKFRDRDVSTAELLQVKCVTGSGQVARIILQASMNLISSIYLLASSDVVIVEEKKLCMQPNTAADLPKKILVRIFKLLDLASVEAAAATCRRYLGQLIVLVLY